VTTDTPAVTASQLRDQFVALGARPGDLLAVQASMRSIGPVRGGADAALEALLEAIGPEGTLVALAFVESFPLPLSAEHAGRVVTERTPSYAGALANAMIRHPRMHRSRHPIQKFVAIGRLAERLMREHTPESGGYDVLLRMTKMGGRHLKLGANRKIPGVGTGHIAQNLLGFRQRLGRRGVMYRDRDGEERLFEANWAGGCSRGFSNFLPLYEKHGAIVARGRIGAAEAMITEMEKTLEAELEVLSREPRFFMCDNPWCYSCRASWEFSKKTPRWFLLKYVIPGLRAAGVTRLLRRMLRRDPPGATA
jgi:aminoglycoside N3'-acetyltransferase